MTLLDTAEMYGDGRSQRTEGEAIRSFPREKLFLVSNVYPHNADRRWIFLSCENTLRRMKGRRWTIICSTGAAGAAGRNGGLHG
jgi:diketogulonate reductase-like aldo/keto reductase